MFKKKERQCETREKLLRRMDYERSCCDEEEKDMLGIRECLDHI